MKTISEKGLHSTLVELHHVRLTLDRRHVLRDITWFIRRGEGWLVTGANGSGKTSLLRLLAGQIWPDPGRRGGERTYYFDAVANDSPLGLAGRIAWLSPETHQRFARIDVPQTAGDVIQTGFAGTLLLTERPTAAQLTVARRIALSLGLDDCWKRPYAELSQGRQRLVLLARALAPAPELLVLDEFSDGLDHAARALASAAIIRNLRRGAAVIVATHRQSDFLAGLSRHLTIRDGQARETTMPKESRVGTPLRGVSSKAVGRLNGRLGEPSLPSSTVPTLRLVRANVSIGDHARVKRILHNITWTVQPGENWAVLGANGSGKSTLLRAIYGDLPVARGGILERFGHNSRTLPLPAARRLMGYVSPALQHFYSADATVLEVVASGFQSSVGLLRAPARSELAAARSVLRSLCISQLAMRHWGALSFGETRLALLARALVPGPRLLLLDEPCDGLAPAVRVRFLRAVARAVRAGAQVIVAAHRAEDWPACISHVLHLRHGRITES